MDIQRTVLWLIFSFSILLLWNNWQTEQKEFLNKPISISKTEIPSVSHLTESLTKNESSSEKDNIINKPLGYSISNLININTDVLNLTFDTLGARIVQSELLKYQNTAIDGKPTILINYSPSSLYLVQSGIVGTSVVNGENFPTHYTPFRLISEPKEHMSNDLNITFEAESGGLKVIKTFTLYQGKYNIDVCHKLINTSQQIVSPSLYLQLERSCNDSENNSNFYHTFTGIAIYSKEAKFQKVSFSNIRKNKAHYIRNTDNGWIAVVQHYFVTAWIPTYNAQRQNEVLEINQNKNLFAVRTIEPIGAMNPGSSREIHSCLWTGPQDQKAMANISPGLELVVDYGFLTIIAKPLFNLMTLIHGLLGNWGWTIVFLTILVKVLFFPMASASYRSMERMKYVTPRIQALKEKYKNDKQKFNSAMIAMYRNEKINPLGGCLPMLIQIPVFISLYWVLLASVEMHGAPWILWIKDLSVQDPFFILPSVMMITMFVQIRLNPTPPDPIQAKVMLIMPLVFGSMMFFFPAGLVLYWCVNNILSITQQWFITRKLLT